MNQASVTRVNPWLLVAIVAVVLLLAAALLVVSQPGLAHAIGSIVWGPMAPICSGGVTPCP